MTVTAGTRGQASPAGRGTALKDMEGRRVKSDRCLKCGMKAPEPRFGFICSSCKRFERFPTRRRHDWRDLAACAPSPEMSPEEVRAFQERFFPDQGTSGKRVNEVKALCAECPVQVDCLEFAMDFPDMTGIWGGLTERQRRLLRAARRSRAS